MRKQFIVVFLVSAFSSAVLADFETAMQAFDRRDYRQAVEELEPLANAGDPYAQYMLGRLYMAGNGVIQDFVEAHKWFNLAAARNHGYAAQAREATASRMNSAQIGRAQELARRWQPDSAASGERDDDDDRDSPRAILAGIQEALNQLGYDAGPVDGAMGRRTRQAILDYQADMSLRQTGESTGDLLEHIERTLRESRRGENDRDDRRESRLILSDSFNDGNYTRNPRWTVVTGEFTIDRSNGLRSIAAPYQSFNRQPARANTAEEIGLAVLQAILQQAAGVNNQNQTSRIEYAEIYVPARIDNAFILDLTLNARDTQGPLEFGVYQGRDRDVGYRLVIAPEGQLVLVRLARSGNSVIQTSRRTVNLRDGQQHRLRWVRRADGEMRIEMDRREMISAVDRGFRDDFSGFVWINRGGDYGLRGIDISGR